MTRGMPRAAAAIAATVFLTACASETMWTKPGTDARTARMHLARCELLAEQGYMPQTTVTIDDGQPATIPPGSSRAGHIGSQFGEGLGQGFAEGMRRARHVQRIRDLCMKSLGYVASEKD